MNLTFELTNYAIKKGLSKKSILILYSLFYFVLYVVLLVAIKSNIAGLVVISIFYYLKIWSFNKFLKRHNF